MRRPTIAYLCAVGLAGCASTSAHESFRDVGAAIEARSGHSIVWNQGTEEDARVEQAIDRLLSRELSPGDAVQIALLSNRELQAEYEELAIAQADLVQAGLLSNPRLSGSIGFSIDGSSPDLGAGVELDFLSILFLPAKKKVAAARLEATKARVAASVLDLAARVRTAYWRLSSSLQVAALERVIAAATQATAELAQRQAEAGNIGELEALGEQGIHEEAVVALAKTETEIAEQREELNELMGLWGKRTMWRISERLPELPASDPPLAGLETLAIGQRFDVAAARHEVSVASMAATFAKSSAWIGDAHVGAEIERDDGEWDLGPSAGIELPIFDQGQARIARAEAELRRARHVLAATSINARAEVRKTHAKMTAARALAERHQRVLVPMRERLVRLGQERYDAMLMGVYDLVQLKREEVETYRSYVEAVRDYWIARAALERAVGGRLPASPAPEKARPPVRPPAGEGGHRH